MFNVLKKSHNLLDFKSAICGLKSAKQKLPYSFNCIKQLSVIPFKSYWVSGHLNTFCISPGSYKFYNQYCTKAVEMRPTGIVDDWRLNLTPQELTNKTEDLINDCKKLLDIVGNVPDADVSFETVLKILNEVETALGTKRYLLDSSQHFSPDEGIRNASTEADRKLGDFCIEIRMRKDIFQKLLILKEKESLKPEAQRYLDRLILLGKRNALHLDDDTQQKVKEFNSKLNSLSIDFLKNMNDVTTTLQLSDEQLDGLDEDFLKSLKRDPDTERVEVTLKYPHFFPIMEKCKVPGTRKMLEFAFNTQCLEENNSILAEMRKLRHEVAVLLGYPSHAAFITEILMSGSAETVDKFLSELTEKLLPLWQEEKKFLLELKKNECDALGLPFDGTLNCWDTAYYLKRTEEIKYAVDQNKLKEYFPLPVVKRGLLDIYQDLLGMEFEQVEGEVWHEDVELFSVKDSSSGNLLGYFFLDLFPRPNKYSHAALFELQHGVKLPDGTRQVAVGGMVANFNKPIDEKPALLDFNEVVTFFHEFGHVMHYLCISVEFPYFHIMNVERDFLEAPSQMLENWCWEEEPLKKMSSHYRDQTPIPAEMLDSLIKSRLANVAYKNLRQIVLARFDQIIHTNPENDVKDIFFSLMKNTVGVEPQPGTNFACHFGHLAKEYDAQYYGYLWSEVYSMDMFYTKFKGDNILNPDVGKEYRKKILEPGGTRNAWDLLTDFLGREPTQQAFLESKGLKI